MRPDPVRPSARFRPPVETTVVPTTLTCIDTETVPDTGVAPHDPDPDVFPPIPHHRIVALSMVESDIVRRASGGESFRVKAIHGVYCSEDREASLVARYWEHFNRRPPRVVTWNGRGFDMVLLKMRAMVHGVQASGWDQTGDKWQGYNKRYSPDWHCDLADVMTDNGGARSFKQDDAAKAIGLPGKMGMHGSKVAGMIAEGRYDLVSAYCDHDAITLHALYVRWAFVSGRLDASGHNESMTSLMDHLENNRGRSPHLGNYLDAWLASDRPMPSTVPVPAGMEPAPSSVAAPRSRGSMVPERRNDNVRVPAPDIEDFPSPSGGFVPRS